MVFDKAYQQLLSTSSAEQAQSIKEASSHWLRHTDASMEVERGRSLKDLSEDLGRASKTIMDSVYIQTESKKCAALGKQRKVT
jgi:site-specific recombinase XerD